LHKINSLVEFGTVFTHPFKEIFDEDVLVEAVHQEPYVGIAVRIYSDEVWHNHKRVSPAVFGIQFFNCERALASSNVD